MTSFTYRGSKTREISFPLGGLGTGCLGVGGNGRLLDWEIFNRPSKGSVNGFSHFAVKAERGDAVVDARVLQGDLQPPYQGQINRSFGSGPPRETLAGMPHFSAVAFRGRFPVAELSFPDPSFPGQVTLTAFNPFIPLNEHDSGLPAAFFEVEITNTTSEPLTYTVAGVLANPLPAGQRHQIESCAGVTTLHLSCDSLAPEDVRYGTLTLATDAAQVSGQEYWYRGGWMDNLEVWWRDFTSPGALVGRTYPLSAAGEGNHGALAARLALAPGASGRVRYVIAWHFPTCETYWRQPACACGDDACAHPTWRNYYATVWEDSQASALYALENWDRLSAETNRFVAALYGSTLPPAALEAVGANLSILKSPTVLRLEDGTFYGWEGCSAESGCCEGSCTHVWNYAQALAFLFPRLERSVREADYRYNLRPDGGMPFRLQLPLGSGRSAFRPCADGQLGGVLKIYRDWKICGDTEWLRGLWPAVRASLEFAWSPANADRWDPERTGVLWGRQHHTLDMELFGPHSWLTGFYLGALKAGAEMAERLGEADAAADYRGLFQRGRAWVEEHLFNGEYYQQQIDLSDRDLLAQFPGAEGQPDAVAVYWSEEHQEIKYQIGEGCDIDQVLAQWHANLYGLGEIFAPAHVRSALAALFRHNFRQPMRASPNPWRLYCLNDEAGLIVCSWPEGKRQPRLPLPYWPETQNGYEYAAATQMIQSGLVEEGLAVVAAIRDRYDGEKRNPWNEFECGSNYARSLASYALLHAYSGFEFDLTRGLLGFHPLPTPDGEFRTLWSLDPAWGTFESAGEMMKLAVLGGKLELACLRLPGTPESIQVAGREVTWTCAGDEITFAPPVTLGPSEELVVRLS